MAFMEFIKNLAKGTQSSPFDASIFEHPLALKTACGSKASGGANFKTRTLNIISSSKLRYVGSIFGKIFAGLFIGFPIIFLVIGVTALFSGDFHFGILLFLALPLIFIAVGIYFWRQTSTVLVIDKGSGFFVRLTKHVLPACNPQKMSTLLS